MKLTSDSVLNKEKQQSIKFSWFMSQNAAGHEYYLIRW